MAAGGEGDMPRSGSPACSTTLAEMDHEEQKRKGTMATPSGTRGRRCL